MVVCDGAHARRSLRSCCDTVDGPDKLDESSSDDDEPDSKPNDIRNQVFAMRSDASDCDITLETLYGQLSCSWFETHINALRCIC